MSTKKINKPAFNIDQLVPASIASRNFGDLRKKAKKFPLFITDNGNVETVILDYKQFEKMHLRLLELEEAQILKERIERLDNNPSLAVSWRTVRRSGKEND